MKDGFAATRRHPLGAGRSEYRKGALRYRVVGLLSLCVTGSGVAADPAVVRNDLFVSGQDGYHPEVYCPVCQAGLLRLPSRNGRTEDSILYSAPGGPGRSHMTVRLSRDAGKTWPVERVLDSGPAAYSDLVVLPNGEIGCLYERGVRDLYEKLTFARFHVEWMNHAENPESRRRRMPNEGVNPRFGALCTRSGQAADEQ